MPQDVRGLRIFSLISKAWQAQCANCRMKSGHWHTVLNHSETYLENSIAFLFVPICSKNACRQLLHSSS